MSTDDLHAGRVRGCGGLFLVGLLALASGCASTRTFVYKPSVPPGGATPVPVKLAVVPFTDGTEDFEKRGSVWKADSLVYNLAKAGVPGTISAVTPAQVARSLAEELAVSGRFASVRFIYGASEALDEPFLLEGVVTKADWQGGYDNPSEYAVEVRAVRRSDGRVVWEHQAAWSGKSDRKLYDGCGVSIYCMNDRFHAELNGVLQALFKEIGAKLAEALAGGAAGKGSTPAEGAPAEAVESTIQKILEGN